MRVEVTIEEDDLKEIVRQHIQKKTGLMESEDIRVEIRMRDKDYNEVKGELSVNVSVDANA